MTISRLTEKDIPLLQAMLVREPVQNLYLLGLLAEFGVEPAKGRPRFGFYGRFQGKTLAAALFVGGNGGLVVPSASDPIALAEIGSALAKRVKLLSALGDLPAVDAVVRQLLVGRPRYTRSQRLYAVSADDLGPFTNPTLRLATQTDLAQLLPMAAGAMKEMLGRHPLQEDPAGFERRVLQRIEGKRTYVLEVESKLVFKLEVGSRSPHGAELEGLYTLPDQRRCGHATLCLGQISRHLLSSLPRLTLRIDDKQTALASIARKVGYLGGKSQRLVIAG